MARYEVPTGQEITSEYVQSLGSAAGAAASPTRQQEAQAAAAQPAQGGGFMNALMSAVKDRTIGPLLTLNQMLEPTPTTAGPGGLGVLPAAAAINQLVTTAFAPGTSALGALAEAAGSARFDPDTGKLMGGLVEIFTGGARYAGKRIATKLGLRASEKALKALPGGAEFLPEERLSTGLATEARRVLKGRENAIKPVLDKAEKSLVGAAVASDSPAYGHVADALDFVEEAGIQLDAQSKRLVDGMRKAIAAGDPLKGSDLVKLRHSLSRPSAMLRGGDPDVAANAKLIGGVRNRITTAVENAMEPETAKAYAGARSAYRTEITEPKRAIRTVLNRKATPMAAFNSAFNIKDPNAFRTLVQLSKKSPAMRTKLRLGYLDTLRTASKNFDDVPVVMKHFERTRPLIEGAGLFNKAELDDLFMFLRRKDAFAKSGAQIAATVGKFALRRGIAAAAGAGGAYVYTADPLALATMALAAGVAPGVVRRLAMLPQGSVESKRLAALTMNQIVKGADMLFSEETADPGEAAEAEGEP